MPKYCPSCGTEVEESAVYCPSCGGSIQSESGSEADKKGSTSDKKRDANHGRKQGQNSRTQPSGQSSGRDDDGIGGLGRRELLILGGLGGAGLLWYLIEGREPEHTLTNGGTVEGRINVDSPFDPIRNDLAEPHYFRSSAGERVEVSMRSRDFDTYLLLVGPTGNEVETDDDGGTDLNSRLTTVLPRRGEYTIWAGSYSGDATGSYTLSVFFRNDQSGDSVF